MRKRAAEPGSAGAPEKKTARIDAEIKQARKDDAGDVDMDEDEQDAKSSASASVDPMAALENESTSDGPVAEAPAAESHIPGVAPVRADEFSTEAEREIEAAKGLGGEGGEEGKMKLVHSVRHQVSNKVRDCRADI
jgi:ATP-dependent RNA helicase DOB1